LECYARYEKERVSMLCDRYIETGNPDDFGELLMALSPMVWILVRKYRSSYNHHQDMHQEIMMALWKNQRNVNMLKLKRMRRKPNGERACMSIYFYFVIRSYTFKAWERFKRTFEKDIPYRIWFHMEDWMGNIEIDEKSEIYGGG